MIAIAVYAAIPMMVIAALVTVWTLKPVRLRFKLRPLWVPPKARRTKMQKHFTMTAEARRVRYTSSNTDIRDWDVKHIPDNHMVIHHGAVIVGMCVMVVVILASGETAGAIATGALATHDGTALIQELLSR